MGGLFLVAFNPVLQALSAAGTAWLVWGDVLYAGGAIILALDRPRLWPGRFGSHDLWHLFVLGGSACHFVTIRCFVAAAGV
jgi:hemolysin III